MRAIASTFWPTLSITVLVLAILWLFNRFSHAQGTQTVTAMLMFAPAIYMTLRQGWIGAVGATVLANLTLELTMRGDPSMPEFDMPVLIIQVLMALICSGLLLFGAILTQKEVDNRILTREHRRSKKLARQNLQWGESRLRYSAEMFDKAFASIQYFFDSGLAAIGSEVAPSAIATLKWGSTGLAKNTYRRTILGMRLETLEVRGLRKALMTGPIALVLGDSGIDYSVRVSGPANALPFDIQSQLYRIAYETVMRFCSDYNAYRIAVRIRVLASQKSGVALVIKAWPGAGDRVEMPPACIELEEIDGAAQTFDGIFHDRTRRRHPSISLLLRDF
jgi:glucose-6-phosphate-specific signal transduction histidine kinase